MSRSPIWLLWQCKAAIFWSRVSVTSTAVALMAGPINQVCSHSRHGCSPSSSNSGKIDAVVPPVIVTSRAAWPTARWSGWLTNRSVGSGSGLIVSSRCGWWRRDLGARPRQRAAQVEGVEDLGVHPVEEGHVGHADDGGGGPLLALAQGAVLRHVHVRVPGTLLPAGHADVAHVPALAHPERDRSRGAEVDVVGMGEDGKGTTGRH